MYKRIILHIIIVLISLSVLSLPISDAGAQAEDIIWSVPINLSNSESISTDPVLIADPAGGAHLFWAEKMGPAAIQSADTIMYAYWDGISWSHPIDILFPPDNLGNPQATYPRGVLDQSGRIHLLWRSQPDSFTLNYSVANAWQAGLASAWQTIDLAIDVASQKYSYDIGWNDSQGMHVVYAKDDGSNRGVTYLRSMDGGLTWSEPVDIYTVDDPERGASDVRVLLEPPNNIYASWTEWDIEGNGQAIYFTRSLDNGQTWEHPITLAVRIGDEYERDWNNMILLGENQLVSIWEGGWRAYRGAMYSYDGGKSWTDPDDVFPWLIGDNGSVEFAYDSAGTLHAFIANRIREGYELELGERDGLWHSVWEGGTRWREPTLMTLRGGTERMTNPKIAIVDGNKIVAVWYGSHTYEIMVMTGEIQNVPELQSQPWITPTPTQGHTPTLVPTEPELLETMAPTQAPFAVMGDNSAPLSPSSSVLIGVLPAFVLLLSIIFVVRIFNRKRHNQNFNNDISESNNIF